MPSEVIINANNIIIHTKTNNWSIDKDIFSIGAKNNIIIPCNKAMVVPPATFPKATAILDTGATITSFKKPNSLSQTIDTAENTDVNNIVIVRTPGNINCLKSTLPPPISAIAGAKPLPKVNK